MLVCHCKAVSDRQIRTAQALGARCCREIARETGAGSVCGGCIPTVRELLAETVVPCTEHSLALPEFAAPKSLVG